MLSKSALAWAPIVGRPFPIRREETKAIASSCFPTKRSGAGSGGAAAGGGAGSGFFSTIPGRTRGALTGGGTTRTGSGTGGGGGGRTPFGAAFAATGFGGGRRFRTAAGGKIFFTG